MEELIWFSIPGAVLAAAIIAVWPSSVTSANSIIWVVLVPLIGFVAHQTFRLIFELTGGFARRSRITLRYISKAIARQESVPELSFDQAFLIWEIVFYSDDFPAAFRDHDRGAWHYILSFWGVSLSAMLSIALCLTGYVAILRTTEVLLVAVAELLIAVIFYLKGRSTYYSLIRQESALVSVHENLFIAAFKKLKSMH
jgi:hypothetical protein